jgi:DNA-binding FadR family transcriptional regulator
MAMSASVRRPPPTANRLLAALPAEDFQRLLSLDRLPSNELRMTQELIAKMLGVRREGVTEAAGKLQAAGLIHYSRGKITVIDRGQLEARVCECYLVVRRETDRLFPAKII